MVFSQFHSLYFVGLIVIEDKLFITLKLQQYSIKCLNQIQCAISKGHPGMDVQTFNHVRHPREVDDSSKSLDIP